MHNNRVYFYATIFTIGFILINQLFIQYWLYQKKSDAEIINKSGKQRMLSQRLVSLSFAYRNNLAAEEKNKINNLYREWKTTHQYLVQHFEPQYFNQNSKDIQNRLSELTPRIDRVANYIDDPILLSATEMDAFKTTQDQFLLKMDGIVKTLEEQSNQKLTLLVTIEILFAMLSLFMVYYEITFVFKRINEELVLKNEDLLTSNKMLERYAYFAAHDLRAPIQNVIGFIDVLEKSMGNRIEDQERRIFDFLKGSASRSKRTTDDLLQFSFITNEAIKIETCAPKEILDNVINDLSTKIKEREATVNMGVFPEQISGDKHLLHLVFQNLIANGLKFVPEDVTPSIEVTYKNDEQDHVFMVQDNGIGIDIKNQEKIFDIFERLHRKDQYQGTGIGLSICEKVIDKHRGHIRVESEPNKGSRFFVSIPKALDN